jgi:phage baseplate assembly protein W
MDFKILGWKFPPTFNEYSNTVEMVSDKESIKESLYVLLTTTPGERLMVLDYGCDLNVLAFKKLDLNLTTFIQNNIKSAIIRWEKRIDVTNVKVSQIEDDNGIIKIDIEYIIKNTNETDVLSFIHNF